MATETTSQSGHDARSAKTREHLIEAAIEVVGAVGYEGASTRALAKAANANLSAIPYHFGSKKELYLAAAQMIADYARGRFAEVTALLDEPADADPASRFEKALIHLLHIVLDDAERHSWTSFLGRCTYDNDDAFALIHDQAIAPLLDRLIRSASVISGQKPGEATLRLRISAIVTAIIGFRFLRGIMLRGMDGESIQAGYVRQMEDMVRDLCRSDFLRASQPR
ncbi:MAG: TetR family transcriptional regulator [Azorhizobium sp. 32-67-21]|uniref:CerR family C-terminal domain-containing protein n=1 Tax=Xanthobacter TaxID=279 RepID=UPI000BCB95AD|nr:MAG: TetR family transcriptional regulator [Azorhizobium sp. 32-67-21]